MKNAFIKRKTIKRHCTRFTGSNRYACSHSSPHA